MNFDRIPLSRRHLLKYSAASLVGGTALLNSACSSTPAPAAGIIGTDGKPVLPWSNWSGNQSCQPSERYLPRTEDDLRNYLKSTHHPIRMLGSGHSFSALVPTEHSLISLARLRGVEHIDPSTYQADLWAGTRLSQLSQTLWDNGLSVINAPDIDAQSWAGAVATATHGTGRELQSLSSHMLNLRLLSAHGELLECSPTHNSDLFYAMGCNLGALGIMTHSRIQAQPAYYLKEHSWMMSEEEGLASAAELSRQHRHYEMFAIPHSDYMLGISIDKISPDAMPSDPTPASSDAYEAFRMLASLIDYLPFARRWLVNYGCSTVQPETRYGSSADIFGNLRDIRFNEMEYSVPAEYGPQCLREILTKIKKDKIPVIFPIEARYVKADSHWLSPFYQRDSFAISLHNFHDKEYKGYFAAIEPIFWKYEGRPHWGKIHSLSALNFAARYERFNDFLALRQQLDPNGRLLNPHLRHLLGVQS